MKRPLALVLAMLLPGAAVFGQSLAELAENAKKKRKKSTPVYTDDDLRKHSPVPSASPSAGPGSAAAGRGVSTGDGAGAESSVSGVGEGGDGDEREGGRRPPVDAASWRAERASRVAAMKQAEQRIAAAQARLSALNADVVPSDLGDPFRLQTIEAEKTKARQELEGAELELEQAEDAMEAFEEDARKKGVPPGWLREP